MGKGPHYDVVPNDWIRLESIVSDLCTRFVNSSVSTLTLATAMHDAATVNVPLTIATQDISLAWNTTNLKLTSNELNTIQDIDTTASPEFVDLTLTGDLVVDNITLNGANITTEINLGAQSKVDEYSTGQTGFIIPRITVWYGQTFTTTEEYYLSSVQLPLYKSSGGTGTFTVDIHATDAGKPTGVALATGTRDISDLLTTPGQWEEIAFDPPILLSDATKYAIVCHADVDLKVYWGYDATSPTYGGGAQIFSSNAGGTWSILTAYDCMFKTYKKEVTYDDLDINNCQVNINAGLKIGTLAGVLKATVGIVSGSATTSDLSEGTNLYYTEARVSANTSVAANTTHSGLTSGNPHSVTPTELGLVIGTNVQAYDAGLTSLSVLTWSSGTPLIQATALDTYALTESISITGTGHFGAALDTDSNLTVDGIAGFGIAPVAGRALNIAGTTDASSSKGIYLNCVSTRNSNAGVVVGLQFSKSWSPDGLSGLGTVITSVLAGCYGGPKVDTSGVIGAGVAKNVTVSEMVGFYTDNYVTGGGTHEGTLIVAEAIGLHVRDPSVTDATITTNYGIKIEGMTAGTTDWSIASLGGNSYHVGNFRIGSDVAPTVALDVTGAGKISTTLTVAGALGCNGKAAQTAYASGGALAAYTTGAFGLDSAANMSALHAMVVSIRAALVANGIMS